MIIIIADKPYPEPLGERGLSGSSLGLKKRWKKSDRWVARGWSKTNCRASSALNKLNKAQVNFCWRLKYYLGPHLRDPSQKIWACIAAPLDACNLCTPCVRHAARKYPKCFEALLGLHLPHPIPPVPVPVRGTDHCVCTQALHQKMLAVQFY